MPQQYLGIPSNVAFPAATTVVAASNTNPIQITVSGSLPAQLTAVSGGTYPVDIEGVQGNTNANGVWQATPTGANTFTIPVSGSGAYVPATGTVTYLFPQSYAEPADGDNEDASSVNPAFGALGDRTAFLFTQIGADKLVTCQADPYLNNTGNVWCQQSADVGLSVWNVLNGSLAGSGPFPSLALAGTTSDTFDISFTGTVSANAGTGVTLVLVGLVFQVTQPGGSLSASGWNGCPGGSTMLLNASGTTAILPLSLTSLLDEGVAGVYNLGVGVWQVGLGTLSVSFYGAYNLTARQLRPTNVPQ